MVSDYSLIESDNPAELVEAVTTACRTEGWSPQGGICVSWEPSGPLSLHPSVYYAQALVKYAERN